MMPPLSVVRWLSTPRSADTLVAWRGDQVWTLGHLRDDVAHCVERLQQHQGQRWALCFDDSYLFLVALLATLHAHKTPVIRGIAASLNWKSNARCSMACSVKSLLAGAARHGSSAVPDALPRRRSPSTSWLMTPPLSCSLRVRRAAEANYQIAGRSRPRG